MPSDQLTSASNVAFGVAVVLYLAATLGYFHHLAFRRRRVLVTARATAYVGAAVHAGSIVTRGIVAGRVPWGNLFEYVTVASFLLVVAYLVIERRWRTETVGGFALGAAVAGLGAATLVYVPPGPLVPALNSYWKVVHVGLAMLATALFTLGFVFTILYLVQERRERRLAGRTTPVPAREPALVTAGGGDRPEDYVAAEEPEEPARPVHPSTRSRLPDASTLDRLAYRTIVFAFPIWTLGPLIFGSIWAEEAWGRYWGWDPKEVWAFVTWVVFAGYLHARATVGWRGRRAAILAIVGFAALVFNLIVVNTAIAGLHSYAQ
ncbi:MAG: c-type cytochrome biogenesis protein CcsB [Actinomycetota bacterium]